MALAIYMQRMIYVLTFFIFYPYFLSTSDVYTFTFKNASHTVW